MSKTAFAAWLRSRTCIHLTGSAALAVAAALAGTGVHAATWSTCNGHPIKWNDGGTNMYISTLSFPPGSSWDTDLQNAMWHWNHVAGSGFNFYVARDTDGAHNGTNGVNEIYWSSTETGSALATTFSRWHCYWVAGYWYGVDEADIAFNNNYTWSVGAFNYAIPSQQPYNFELVALHELGHVMGLNHEDQVMATMNSFYANGGPLGYAKQVDPLGDDRTGARAMYGDGTGEVDVAASAMKRTGIGTVGLVNSTTSIARGQVVPMEFTFSNLGTATANFVVNFYLSSNDVISTADRFLGWGTWWGETGFTGTVPITWTIPADVAPGTYYLGFLIDPSNTMSEADETNNSQPMPRAITIY